MNAIKGRYKSLLVAEQAQREILFPSEPIDNVRTHRLFGDYPGERAVFRL